MKKLIDKCSEGFIPLLGRVLLSLVFINAGWSKLTGWEGTSSYMASAGMPLIPFFLAGAIAVELFGGLSLLLGIRARIGAAVLFLFMIPTTFIFHQFWAVDAQMQGAQMAMFIKNLAIMGGLLMLAAHGSGRFSLDRLPCPFRPKKVD